MTFKQILIVAATALAYPLIRLLDFARSHSDPADGLRILIVNNAKIGDIVCSTPVYRAIHESYPQSEITILVNPKTVGIIKQNPRISSIVPLSSMGAPKLILKMIRQKFAASVAMTPGTLNYLVPFFAGIPLRSGATAPEYGWYHRALAALTLTHPKRLFPNELSVQHYLDLLKPLGILNTHLRKEVYVLPGATEKARVFYDQHGIRSVKLLVGFALGAGNRMKEWPIGRFVETARRLYEEHAALPVLFGGPGEKELVLHAVGELRKSGIEPATITDVPLEELPAYISPLDYFVSVDTGILYIANALDVPVVDIAGPCNIYDQMPIYEKCEAVHVKGLPGWPYSSVLKTVDALTPEQRQSITGISVEMVVDAFERLKSKYG